MSDIGEQLEAFAGAVDFEIFREPMTKAVDYADGSKGGCPPYEVVMMFKILVIQSQNNLINDRLSFQRFLGLTLADRVPDAKTIWLFRERLTKAGVIKQILKEYSINVVTWDLIEPHEVREYCVQYRETHYEFITRIAAEEALNGIGAK